MDGGQSVKMSKACGYVADLSMRSEGLVWEHPVVQSWLQEVCQEERGYPRAGGYGDCPL